MAARNVLRPEKAERPGGNNPAVPRAVDANSQRRPYMERNRPRTDRPAFGHCPRRPWAELERGERVRYVLISLAIIAGLVAAGYAGSGPAL